MTVWPAVGRALISKMIPEGVIGPAALFFLSTKVLMPIGPLQALGYLFYHAIFATEVPLNSLVQ